MLSTLLLSLLLQQPVAVLDDGTRLQVLPEVEVDSFHVVTPHGKFRTSGQQVVELLDSAHEIALLAPLRDLDYASWVFRLNERGLIDRLLQEPITDSNREMIFEALAGWGARLDPLHSKTKRDLRVDKLWKQMLDAKGGQRALLVGALQGEISKTSSSNKRRVSLSDWRKSAKSKDITLRWSAAKVAGIQLQSDMEVLLLDMSLEDKNDWVARTSAQSLIQTDPRGALHRWAYEMVMAKKESMQLRAAFMLGEYGSAFPELAEEISQLILTEGYYLAGGINGGLSGGGCDTPVPNATTAGTDFGRSVTEGSVLEVRTPNKSQMRSVSRALQNVYTLGGQAKIPPRTDADGELIVYVNEADKSKAWRLYLLGISK
ncbi:MAG: hypothetical protein COA70_05750 [Planctomycetota bacterium]|nr:MAG: hypothetical protein COA70_05750 [Planctomycetota bacterium]